MNVTFYMPYFDYNDDSFSVDNNYYKDNDYTNKLVSEYEKYKDIIYETMSDSTGSHSGLNGNTYMMGQKSPYKEDKISYAQCQGLLYDMDNNPETVDNLITYFSQQEMFITRFRLDFNSSDEEFETEFGVWNRGHDEIHTYESYGEDWVLQNEPKRNVKICFKNNANKDIYAELVNCKIIERVKVGEYIILVEKINLIDKFI